MNPRSRKLLAAGGLFVVAYRLYLYWRRKRITSLGNESANDPVAQNQIHWRRKRITSLGNESVNDPVAQNRRQDDSDDQDCRWVWRDCSLFVGGMVVGCMTMYVIDAYSSSDTGMTSSTSLSDCSVLDAVDHINEPNLVKFVPGLITEVKTTEVKTVHPDANDIAFNSGEAFTSQVIIMNHPRIINRIIWEAEKLKSIRCMFHGKGYESVNNIVVRYVVWDAIKNTEIMLQCYFLDASFNLLKLQLTSLKEILLLLKASSHTKAGGLEKDKAAVMIHEAVDSYGAQIVVFPEAFIGGYPRGSNFGVTIGSRSAKGKEEFQKYHASAIDVSGPEVERLAAMAKNGV